ncbi:transposase [Vibrio sp. SS-MA-C1-2]|uniref:transposase n=1 Tax=Vibrio sp. SS-MA-C1-2 TaxID=2908646 RepID=UPI001F2CC0AA|nr:transposase [Vibrio sp. SS-MA-C1-2]
MPRTHGYSDKGTRCYGVHNWQSKGRVKVIGAIINHLFLTFSIFSGNINSDVFHSWVEQDLLPKAPKESVIIMDNASFHKRTDTLRLIEEAGITILWLPPYSPELNPIEKSGQK